MSQRNPTKLLTIALILSLTAALVFAYNWQRADKRARTTERWTHFVMDSLGTTLTLQHPPATLELRDSIYWQWVATGAQLQSRRWAQAVRHWAERRSTVFDEVELELLKREGLQDPPKQLRDSLVTHPELIPFGGIHGGTMQIAPGDKIILLRPPHVFAEFDDGHIGGYMLVKYTIIPRSRILWERLWAVLDE